MGVLAGSQFLSNHLLLLLYIECGTYCSLFRENAMKLVEENETLQTSVYKVRG